MTERTCPAADVAKALKACSGGDTLRVDGDIKGLRLSGLAFPDRGVTIAGRFVGYTTFAGCPGITLTGEMVETAGTMALGVSNSERFRLEAMTVRGQKLDAEGYFDGVGAAFTDCGPGCEIVGVEFRGLGSGLAVKRGDGLLVRAGKFHDIKTDAIDLYGAWGVTIDDNDFFDFFPETDDHPDCVQIHLPAGWRAAERITITNNRYRIGRGRPVQGLQLKAEEARPLKGLVVRGNSFFGGMFIGVNAEWAPGAVIDDNFMQGLATNLHDGKPMGAFLYLRNCADAVATRNVANPGIPLARDAGDTAELDKWMAAHAAASPPAPAPAADPRDAQITALTAQVAALTEELKASQAEAAKLKAQLAQTDAALSAAGKALTATVDALDAGLAGVVREIEAAQSGLAA